MIRTGMRWIIELIRKHLKIRRILRCESPYFHHWESALVCWVASMLQLFTGIPLMKSDSLTVCVNEVPHVCCNDRVTSLNATVPIIKPLLHEVRSEMRSWQVPIWQCTQWTQFSLSHAHPQHGLNKRLSALTGSHKTYLPTIKSSTVV